MLQIGAQSTWEHDFSEIFEITGIIGEIRLDILCGSIGRSSHVISGIEIIIPFPAISLS